MNKTKERNVILLNIDFLLLHNNGGGRGGRGVDVAHNSFSIVGIGYEKRIGLPYLFLSKVGYLILGRSMGRR